MEMHNDAPVLAPTTVKEERIAHYLVPTQMVAMEVSEQGTSSATSIEVGYRASNIHSPRPNKIRLSGAQRRKILIQKAIDEGKPKPPRRKSVKANTTGWEEKYTNTYTRTPSFQSERSPFTGTAPGTEWKKGFDTCKSRSESYRGPTYRNIDADKPLFKHNVHTDCKLNHKMAIVPLDYPVVRFSNDTIHKVKNYLVREIYNITEGIAPTFSKTYDDRGAIMIICDNNFSRQWLEDIAHQLESNIEVEVKVVLAKNLIHTVKAIFWVSNEIKSLIGGNDNKRFIARLKLQNPKLNINDISIVSVQVDDKGTTFVVALDDKSLTALREASYKLNLGLSKINVRIPSEKKTTSNAGNN